jgi:hypothetical protein
MRSFSGCYKQDKEIEGSTALEAITRQRLEKTKQTEELVRAVSAAECVNQR